MPVKQKAKRGRFGRKLTTRMYGSRWKNGKGRIRQASKGAHRNLACTAIVLRAQQRLRHIQPQDDGHGAAHSPVANIGT